MTNLDKDTNDLISYTDKILLLGKIDDKDTKYLKELAEMYNGYLTVEQFERIVNRDGDVIDILKDIRNDLILKDMIDKYYEESDKHLKAIKIIAYNWSNIWCRHEIVECMNNKIKRWFGVASKQVYDIDIDSLIVKIVGMDIENNIRQELSDRYLMFEKSIKIGDKTIGVVNTLFSKYIQLSLEDSSDAKVVKIYGRKGNYLKLDSLIYDEKDKALYVNITTDNAVSGKYLYAQLRLSSNEDEEIYIDCVKVKNKYSGLSTEVGMNMFLKYLRDSGEFKISMKKKKERNRKVKG